jgi:hypothetical protein
LRRISEAIRGRWLGAFHRVTQNFVADGEDFHHSQIRLAKCEQNKNQKMSKKKSTRSPRWSIDALAIIRALQLHVTGEEPLEPSRVTAALVLLKKRLPDAVAKPARKTPSRKHREDAEGTLKDLA